MIVALSIVINMNSIKNIWAPLKELPTYYYADKYSEYLMSKGNPLCITSQEPFPYIPKMTVTVKENN